MTEQLFRLTIWT